MEILRIQETASTNSWLAKQCDEFELPVMVYAVNQSRGRGQRGNSWEAEPGKNLTASLAFMPKNILPSNQFFISEAIALAVTDMLKEYGIDSKVKWPNDIYVGDKKICGILIENSILGKVITRTIAGIGLNVNQKIFISDAPNPVSMAQITGMSYSVEKLAERLAACVESRLESLTVPKTLSADYRSSLWRGDDLLYPFYDRKSESRMMALIRNIEDSGMIVLETEDGVTKRYAFKELEFII